ncbi:MAG TPA: response regulator transcription factor [Nocardioides sp.]|nr:response regulator transcription factor [Nocardioides sp.]
MTSVVTREPTRVLIVDDQRLLADALCLALRREGLEPDLAPVTSRDALVDRVQSSSPALVMLDLDLGGELGDGTDLVAPCVAAGSRVLVVSGVTDELWIAAALEQGACAAVDKGVAFEDLLSTVLSAARGDTVMAPHERQRLLDRLRCHRRRRRQELAPFESLTPREQQVLRALSAGMTVPRIAESWVVSQATVRSQVHAVLSKLCVRSQLEAVAAANRVGWV